MTIIPLSKGYAAQVDDVDADLAANRYWVTVNGQRHAYAQRSGEGGKVYLHREIAERVGGPIPAGHVVDHINGDTLDCRRANLRTVPHRVNLWNQHGAGRDSKSGIRGVRMRRGRWAAYICTGRKMTSLGTFDSIELAVAAREVAERARELAAVA